MKLILISPAERYENETELLREMFELGLERFHLRKPDWNETELRGFLKQIPHEFYGRIKVHSHHHIVNEFNLMGVHFTKNYPYKTGFEQVHQSASFHKKDAFRLLSKLNDGFISPVCDSISKRGYRSGFSEEELIELTKKYPSLIALGGVSEKNIEKMKDLGFSGAAVLGAVWNSEKPLNTFKKLKAL